MNLRWAGHPAQEVHCALVRCVPGRCALGSSDREPANDRLHKRTEVFAYDRESDLADGRASIASGSGRRARARLLPRAAGTGRHPHWLELSQAVASGRGGRASCRGRRLSEGGKRSRISSRAAPRARAVRVSRPHSRHRVDSAGLRRDCPAWFQAWFQAWSRGESPARRPVWHRAAFRRAPVVRAAGNQMQGEACLGHADHYLFEPSALHAPARWLPASTPGGPVWLVSSILRWLRAGRLQASEAALLRAHDLVWSGGRWERMRKGERQANPGEPVPGSFSAWVSASGKLPPPQEQRGQPARRTRASRFPGSSRSARPWRGYGSGAWPTSRARLPAPVSERPRGRERSRSLRWRPRTPTASTWRPGARERLPGRWCCRFRAPCGGAREASPSAPAGPLPPTPG